MSLWRNFLQWMGTKMIIAANNHHKLSDHDYIENCINTWYGSPYRRWQIDGERYYHGKHDILRKKREVLGKDGKMVEVDYLPNHKIVDNQYGKICDQKVNYLLGQPLSFSSDDEGYVDELSTVFNKRFNRTLQRLGLNAVTGGISWLYVYRDGEQLKFKVFPAYEVLPFWTDAEHSEVIMCARYYEEQRMDSSNPHDTVRKVELYKPDGIEYYDYDGGRLVPDVSKPKTTYMTVETDGKKQGYNWNRIPLIPFKFNTKEIGLLQRCKSLQDAINNIMSKFNDDMAEDARSTILVLENYGGEDLAEFRQNLMRYSAVKVESGEGGHGDVRTLKIEVNAQNYELVLKALKTAMLENCRGFDFAQLRSGGNLNNMAVRSILSDIDLDANGMETEFQASFEELLWFVNSFLETEDDKQVDVIFNRDTITNETEIVSSLCALGVRVSNETLLSQIPWLDDAEREQKRVEAQERKELDAYGGSLPQEGGKELPEIKYKRAVSNTK